MRGERETRVAPASHFLLLTSHFSLLVSRPSSSAPRITHTLPPV